MLTDDVKSTDQGGSDPNQDQSSASAPPDIETLYKSHYLAIFALARGITLDDGLAEAITQATFQRARRKLRRNPEPVPDQAWLCALATELATARLRRRALWGLPRLPFRLVDQWRRRHEDPGREDPEAVLARLPARSRAAVVLHFVHGYSWSEIAPIVGVLSESGLGPVTGMSCPTGLPERAEAAWIGPSPLPKLVAWLRTPSELERQIRTLRRVTVAVVLALALAVSLIRLAVVFGHGLGIHLHLR